MGYLGRAHGGAEMKEAGTFFVIAAFFMCLFYGYIESQGGFKTSGLASASTCGSTDYRCQARADARDNGLNPDLFERQINQESGFNPNALSDKGAIGIAQIEPSTARGWNVNPWDASASLLAAAKAMSWYQSQYGSWEKALACYNAGCSSLLTAEKGCGWLWKTCLPSETQRYIAAIGG